MGSTSNMQDGALNRLDKLADPILLDGSEEGLDACVFALEKMASSAMKADALQDALRLHNLQNKIERAEKQGEPVKVPPSDALRLSAKLHEYQKNLRDSGDMAGAEDVEQVTQMIDGKIAESR